METTKKFLSVFLVIMVLSGVPVNGFAGDYNCTINGHREVLIAGAPADCTLAGISDWKACEVCGIITVEPNRLLLSVIRLTV